MTSTIEPLQMLEGAITRNKTKKIQEIFALHLQKVENTHWATNSFVPKMIYNVSSMKSRLDELQTTCEKFKSLEDDT